MNKDAPHEIIISLKDVNVRYRKNGRIFKKNEYHQALTAVNLDVYRGESLGIVGRNGAGKSTLLKVIAGILKPDGGTVLNYGVSVSLLSLQAGFDNELTGEENAIMGGMLLGYTKKQMEGKLAAIKEFSGLGSFMEEPIKTYSSGMRSRLGFSVSMYAVPDVLLLDEVLSVGDQEFKVKAEKTMSKKIFSDQTVILVSHSEEQIERFCDRKIAL